MALLLVALGKILQPGISMGLSKLLSGEGLICKLLLGFLDHGPIKLDLSLGIKMEYSYSQECPEYHTQPTPSSPQYAQHA